MRAFTFGAAVAAALLLAAPALGGGVRGDFDGDGFADLAIGAPADDPGGVTNAGAVYVMYGGPNHFASPNRWQVWSQDVISSDTSESGDGFGGELAAGDFDGDGFCDLAVGAPSDSVGATPFAGYVHVIYGTAAGLSADGSQLWSEDDTGLTNPSEGFGGFGRALAAGDFGRSGRDDLAIGIPGDNLAAESAGSVEILFGTSSGLKTTGSQVWTQNSPGIRNSSQPAEEFGATLAAANFGRSPRDDLAITVAERFGTANSAGGAVAVLYGGSTGLAAKGDQLWSEGSPGLASRPNEFDNFGGALTGANFGRGSLADLAIGVPREAFGDFEAGAVHVLYGTASGLTSKGAQFFHQETRGIGGKRRRYGIFGGSLAAANFGRGSNRDLAIGAANAAVAGQEGAGTVNVLYGSRRGLHARGSQFWHQDVAGLNGAAGPADHFGSDLSGANFGASRYSDLAIGIDSEDRGSALDVGAVHVLWGTGRGIRAGHDTILDKTRWFRTPTGMDFFGGALAP